jgi:hypothetical protein
MKSTPLPIVTMIPIALGLLAGCETAKVEPAAAQAKAETPAAAKVDWISLPFEQEMPRFVVAVLPFADGAIQGGAPAVTPTAPQADGSFIGLVRGGLHGGALDGTLIPAGYRSGNVGAGMAAQLKTALSRWENISLIDAEALVRQSDGTFTCKLNPGELGPFVVRGTITEFNESAEGSEKKRGASLGGVGAALGVFGGMVGVPGLSNVGSAVATANPTIQNEERTRKGSVAVDFEVLDGRSTRIVGAFSCSGTFKTVSAVNGVSAFGIGGGGAAFASSALGQATRAALNSALTQTADVLKRAPRPTTAAPETIKP